MTFKSDLPKLIQDELARLQPWQKALNESAKWHTFVAPHMTVVDQLLGDSNSRDLDLLTSWTRLEARKWRTLAEPTRHLIDDLLSKKQMDELEKVTNTVDHWASLTLAGEALRTINRLNARLPPGIEDAAGAVTKILRDLDPRWMADGSVPANDREVAEAPAFSRSLRRAPEFASYEDFDGSAGLQVKEERGPYRSYALSPLDRATLTIALIGLLVSLLSIALQLEQRHIAKVDTIEEARFRKEILQAIRDLAPRVPEARIGHVVTRGPTNVRSEPDRGYRVGVAHQNQVVVVTGHRGRWVKVRYHDHIEGREVEGWVLKHRLLAVDRLTE